jgi:hypothetical protein
MLNSLSSAVLQTPPVRQIRGRDLAFSKSKPCIRAKLAADIVAGRVVVVGLTLRQAARLCRISRGSVIEARRPASETLMKTWTGASPEERRQFIRAVGTESIWNELATAL